MIHKTTGLSTKERLCTPPILSVYIYMRTTFFAARATLEPEAASIVLEPRPFRVRAISRHVWMRRSRPLVRPGLAIGFDVKMRIREEDLNLHAHAHSGSAMFGIKTQVFVKPQRLMCSLGILGCSPVLNVFHFQAAKMVSTTTSAAPTTTSTSTTTTGTMGPWGHEAIFGHDFRGMLELEDDPPARAMDKQSSLISRFCRGALNMDRACCRRPA